MQQLRYGLDNPASKTARESIYLPLVLHVQTGTGAHLASNLMGTGFLLLRVMLTAPLLLVPRLRKSGDLFCVPVPLYGGPGSVVGIATGYGLDGPGIESRWGARFSAPVQTGPGAHPASFTMDTGSFPGVKSDRGVTLTHNPF